MTLQYHIMNEISIKEIRLIPIQGMPLIKAGDNLGKLLLDTILSIDLINEGDIIVIAQKVVSKAEGCIKNLSSFIPTPEAEKIAILTGRDPRLCQAYIEESSNIIEIKGRMVITRHKLGFVGSSAFIDKSNVAPASDEKIVLLPRNPDKSAQNIRKYIWQQTQKNVAIVINDSCGRDHRGGSVGMAIGIAGISPIEHKNKPDLYNNPGKSEIALVDEIAAAGSILMGQSNEGIPAVLIRGIEFTKVEDAKITELLHIP